MNLSTNNWKRSFKTHQIDSWYANFTSYSEYYYFFYTYQLNSTFILHSNIKIHAHLSLSKGLLPILHKTDAQVFITLYCFFYPSERSSLRVLLFPEFSNKIIFVLLLSKKRFGKLEYVFSGCAKNQSPSAPVL